MHARNSSQVKSLGGGGGEALVVEGDGVRVFLEGYKILFRKQPPF